MARRRFFVSGISGEYAELTGDDARHLSQVLRVEKGQLFEISDNASVYLAEIDLVAKANLRFRVIERLPDEAPAILVKLVVALFKFDRLELLLEKATELGVSSVHFVHAERSDKGLQKAADKRMERWRRIVLEASQQSRRVRVPALAGPVQFREAVDDKSASQRLFLDEDRTGAPLLDALRIPASSLAVMVGPEGGWTENERKEARAGGWEPVSLGAQILRAETAGLAALAIANAALRR